MNSMTESPETVLILRSTFLLLIRKCSVKTGVSAGTAMITVTTQDGSHTASSSITVTSGGAGTTTYRIRNVWQNTYLADGGDRVTYGVTASGSSYEWELEDVGGGFMEIKNVATGEYMHIENLTGYIQCTSRTFGWYSSRWAIEDAGNGEDRIRNAWQSNHYVHVENLQGHAQHGIIYTAWGSAKWVLEPFSGSRQGLAADLVSQNSGLSIYPNPVEDKLTVILDGAFAEGANLSLYDLSGTKVLEQWVEGASAEIIRGNLKPGVYMLRVSIDGEQQVRKIVFK